MRKVAVFRGVWSDESKKYELVHRFDGFFHGFGVDSMEVQGGNLQYTTAIVEDPSGNVELVTLPHIRFLEPLPEKPVKESTTRVENLETRMTRLEEALQELKEETRERLSDHETRLNEIR